MFSRPFVLCDLLGPPSLNRFESLLPNIYIRSLPGIFVTKGVTQWILTRALVNLIALFYRDLF
jgi:hypothetical protein